MIDYGRKRITKGARGRVRERSCHGSRRLDERCSNQSRKACSIDKGGTMLPITSHGETVVSLFSPTAAWWDHWGDEVHQLTNQAVRPAVLGIMRRAAGRPGVRLLCRAAAACASSPAMCGRRARRWWPRQDAPGIVGSAPCYRLRTIRPAW